MKSKTKSKSPSATKPIDNQLTLDYLLDRLIKLADVVELQVNRVDKRIDTMTDISNKLQVKVSRLDSWVDKLGEKYDTALLSLHQQLDERAYTKAVRHAATDALQGERMVTNYEGKPAEPKRPTLKWFEQEPQPIEWYVCADPTRLVLTPGTTLRYDVESESITTYDGVTIGELNSLGHNIICEGVKQGAKVHVYLTTARRLGIKLGRPA